MAHFGVFDVFSGGFCSFQVVLKKMWAVSADFFVFLSFLCSTRLHLLYLKGRNIFAKEIFTEFNFADFGL